MKNIFFIATGIVIGCSSCSTRDNQMQVQPSIAPTHVTAHREGEDEEKRIRMGVHRILSETPVPLAAANIYCVKGMDTVSGITDENGEKLLVLPASGKWSVTITHPDCFTKYDSLEVVDSFTEKTYTMQSK